MFGLVFQVSFRELQEFLSDSQVTNASNGLMPSNFIDQDHIMTLKDLSQLILLPAFLKTKFFIAM